MRIRARCFSLSPVLWGEGRGEGRSALDADYQSISGQISAGESTDARASRVPRPSPLPSPPSTWERGCAARNVLRALAVVSVLATLVTPTAGQSFSVAPRRGSSLPAQTTDQHGKPLKISGLSGVSHAGGGVFWACLDNSNKLVRFTVTFDEQGNIRSARAMNGLTLEEPAPFPDAEGIAYAGSDDRGVLVADEWRCYIRRYDLLTGKRLDVTEMPGVFSRRRLNFGTESLARAPDGLSLWTGNEEALAVDGDVSTQRAGSRVRLLRYDLSNGTLRAAEQYVYETDPIHGGHANGARSGLVDLVALPDGTLLSLERSAANTGFRGRIYQLDFTGATEVSAIPSLNGATFTPVTKRLLWKGVPGGLFGQNLEGLCLGPRLASGNWSLLGVVDSGDGLLSSNALLAFELSGPLPALAVNVTLPPGRDWYTRMWRNPPAQTSNVSGAK